MKTMTQEQYAKRERVFIELIQNHTGEENSINYKECLDYMEKYGFKMSYDTLREFITKVKLKYMLPIIYTRGKGYFWAKRKSEIENTIKDLKSMQNALQKQIDLLQKFIIEV